MNISILGTGYVGLVTGVCLAEIGHRVTCIDINLNKIELLRSGISPIFEPGLVELLKKNTKAKRLFFTNEHDNGLKDAEVIYITVGTPQDNSGKTDLIFIEQAAMDLARNIRNDVIVVTKSTVPVGTNDYIMKIIEENLNKDIKVKIVSNPEFLREGSGIFDMFNTDRIIIGSNNIEARRVLEEVNRPFNRPILNTDIRSAEMIKYASNAFLAMKISFINEIANLCERIGVNVENVTKGIGLDKRIGDNFLNAGIGYGGSCFPKDITSLIQIANQVEYDFKLLKAVVEVNKIQKSILIKKAISRFGNLNGKKVALLGLAFKPNTDDVREAPSITIASELLSEGAQVIAYDPIAIENAKLMLPSKVQYTTSIYETFQNADMAFILTEWEEFKKLDLSKVKKLMSKPVLFDGRNCFDLNKIKDEGIEYYSIGRDSIAEKELQLQH